MKAELTKIIDHDETEECPVCRSQEFVHAVFLPAAAAWEAQNELPRFSLAVQGAAWMLGALMEEGFSRDEIEDALGVVLDDVEAQITEDRVLGGPPQGSA